LLWGLRLATGSQPRSPSRELASSAAKSIRECISFLLPPSPVCSFPVQRFDANQTLLGVPTKVRREFGCGSQALASPVPAVSSFSPTPAAAARVVIVYL